jgi:DNA repair exonuclease SbcCD ATPase subunit
MYTQTHTRTIILAEKKTATDTYNKLHNDNLVSDRNIR